MVIEPDFPPFSMDCPEKTEKNRSPHGLCFLYMQFPGRTTFQVHHPAFLCKIRFVNGENHAMLAQGMAPHANERTFLLGMIHALVQKKQQITGT